MKIDYVKIRGYKRFQKFEMKFNERFNVLIGDNESGKSTILEAIDIVLNQRIFNYTDSNFEQFFNNSNKEEFQKDPSFKNLPEIQIELFFKDDNANINHAYLNGYHSSENKKAKTGIIFTYQFNKEFEKEFADFNFDENNAFIPTDYYTATWTTFSGAAYIRRKRPVKMLIIDGTKRSNNIFNSYSRQVFNNKMTNEMKNKLAHSLKGNFNDFIIDNKKELRTGEYTFGIDDDKAYIEQLIDLKADDVSLQHKGKGMESLIKTEIALENDSDVILIEEPENHLSYTNTKELIHKIKQSEESSQIIMTTHSPLVVSRMNLQHTIWLRRNQSMSLEDISDDSANFFRRTDNMDILSFILSEKSIIVEGHSEYILLPKLVKNTFEKTIEEEKINIFSGGGLTYKHYIEVAKVIKSNLLVVTDNDKNEERIKHISDKNDAFEEEGRTIKIVCDTNIDYYTFEVCIYEQNKMLIEKHFEISSGTHAEFKGEKMPQKQAYMLKKKTLSAMRLLEEFEEVDELLLPDYIKAGVKWLIQN